jgi:hypothetical protein
MDFLLGIFMAFVFLGCPLILAGLVRSSLHGPGRFRYRNHASRIHVGSNPIFKKREDGEWHDPKDPERVIVSMTLKEFMEKKR